MGGAGVNRLDKNMPSSWKSMLRESELNQQTKDLPCFEGGFLSEREMCSKILKKQKYLKRVKNDYGISTGQVH